MISDESQLRTRILLTMQVALLGMVSPGMRAVLVSWNQHHVDIRVLFDEEVTNNELELASEIETEVISHLPEFSVSCHAEVAPEKGLGSKSGEVLVFQRI